MSGYQYCACGGCFEILVGEPGDYCAACEREQCDSYDEHGMKAETECLVNPCDDCGAREHYGVDCETCECGPGA